MVVVLWWQRITRKTDLRRAASSRTALSMERPGKADLSLICKFINYFYHTDAIGLAVIGRQCGCASETGSSAGGVTSNSGMA